MYNSKVLNIMFLNLGIQVMCRIINCGTFELILAKLVTLSDLSRSDGRLPSASKSHTIKICHFTQIFTADNQILLCQLLSLSPPGSLKQINSHHKVLTEESGALIYTRAV